MIEQIGFGIVAAVLVISGLRVVTSDNLVRSVLWLAITLSATAVVFVMLSAPFMAGIQLLLYTGGVITLMLFGVMLTSRGGGVIVRSESADGLRGMTTAGVLFGVIGAALYGSRHELPNAMGPLNVTTAELGQSFLTDNLLAFEVLSILLLAAMIGAIVLARPTDHGTPKVAKRFRGRVPADADTEAEDVEEAEDAEDAEPDEADVDDTDDDAEAQAEPEETDAGAETEVDAEARAEDADGEAEAEAEPETDAEAVVDVDAAPSADADARTDADADANANADARTDADAAEGDAGPHADPDRAADTADAHAAQANSEPAVDAAPPSGADTTDATAEADAANAPREEE